MIMVQPRLQQKKRLTKQLRAAQRRLERPNPNPLDRIVVTQAERMLEIIASLKSPMLVVRHAIKYCDRMGDEDAALVILKCHGFEPVPDPEIDLSKVTKSQATADHCTELNIPTEEIPHEGIRQLVEEADSKGYSSMCEMFEAEGIQDAPNSKNPPTE